ncbi:hypothetical protein JW949_01755 [Candidatus Woesearchaeota archaeon]|nr:hypothetical protein [Candidatus Woesearchaeota archaeon]
MGRILSPGKFELWTGCMFSNKTIKMLARKAQINYSVYNSLLIGSGRDTRYAENESEINLLKSHPGSTLTYKEKIIRISDELPEKIIEYINEAKNKKIHAVFIDELQFFSGKTETSIGIVRVIEKLLKEMDMHVFGNGLNLDYRQNYFGQMKYLIDMADEVHYEYATCELCRNMEARYGFRKKPLEELVVAGGKDLYGVACGKCYEKYTYEGVLKKQNNS